MRNEYAHQLSAELMNIATDSEYANLIALTISQKYRFMEVDNGVAGNPTEYTQLLLDCLCNNKFKLRTTSTRNYELSKNIRYIFHGSGVMNTFYKLKEIWDMDAVVELMQCIIERLENVYEPRITMKKSGVYEFGADDIVKGSGYISGQCCGNKNVY